MEKETFDLENLDDIFDKDGQEELLSCTEEDMVREWKPRFSIDMEDHRDVTDEQCEGAKRIYDCLDAHIEANPDEEMDPMICVQDWRVIIDFVKETLNSLKTSMI